MSRNHNPLIIALTLFLGIMLTPVVPARADVLELQPDHPDRYVVVPGDTLWDIATRFLKSPWHWPKIWKINEQIANPHLIYPGDVILLRWVDGQPQLTVLRKEQPTQAVDEEPGQVTVVEGTDEGITVGTEEAPTPTGPRKTIGNREKLRPRVRSSSIDSAIPTIRPEVIAPFLTRPLAVTDDLLDDAGYVGIGLDGRRTLGDKSLFYARGLKSKDDKYYYIFRKGAPLRSKSSGKVYGYEAHYLGDAQLITFGKESKLVVSSVAEEITPGDRLLPVEKAPPLPRYQPRAPDNKIKGEILLAKNSVSEFGPLAIVAISVGSQQGLEKGHVLRIWRAGVKVRDPINQSFFKTPNEESGILLVFKVFKEVSYGLVMRSDGPMQVGDVVETP